MCGRFSLAAAPPDLAHLFHLEDSPALSPRYNIAPSQSVAVVRRPEEEGRRTLDLLQWGLIPPWAKDPRIGSRMINARSETAAEKPAFRSAFRRKRCLVPADGFYEWVRRDRGKQPYHIRMRDGGPFAFAGLWESWKGDEGPGIESCTLLTTRPNDLLRSLHHRMPVILSPEDFTLWLDPELDDRQRLEACLRPYPSREMIAYPVSPRVNNPQHDDPRCVEPLKEG